jgi:hypothetical protein
MLWAASVVGSGQALPQLGNLLRIFFGHVGVTPNKIRDAIHPRLANKDYDKSDAAWRKLAAAGDNAIPFLRERIRPIAVPPLDLKHVEKLLADLDSERFVTREKATRELMSLGELAVVPLQRFLEKPSSVEADRRAHLVLKQLSEPAPTPDRLRALEVLELLEQVHSEKAVALLREIERDALIPQIRREARQASEHAAAAREEKK